MVLVGGTTTFSIKKIRSAKKREETRDDLEKKAEEEDGGPREARERKKFLHTATLNPQRGREQEKNPYTRSEERDVWESASKGRPVPAPRVFTGFVSALGQRRSSPLQSHLGLETWANVRPLFR